ncbi:beta-lactamase family protein [Luteolibacter ambystomatis]|uniref:Beta-lactamase family protein n=1 Tax=Luteolibacter ambystomatis TaxID=2824561 RepID=A0A975PFN0_9BACT|nr:serine hydrolase domain-containing protein [Luteolibacter ambystomatis]QUE51985.1 beta-lactamase family protein [Luteolibacter ambystomatis]
MSVSPAQLGQVLSAFERNFRERNELGASVSVWWQGEEIFSAAQGHMDRTKSREWAESTLVPVYSATKGPASATLLMALEAKGMGPETLVREVWPAFPVAEATFAHLLSHQCGLAALDRRASVWDHTEVVAAVEVQEPAWRPGGGQGYHPRTFGALVEEPVRRLTGRTLGVHFREVLGEPLGLEFWIGLPESEHHRVATLYPGKADKSDLEEGFYSEFHKEGSLVRRAFSSPRGLHSVQEMNDPKAWSAGFPAMGGIGTAQALAKFYQAAIGAIESPLSPSVRAALAETRIQGDDRILMRETVFTCGCQKDPLDEAGNKKRRLYGTSAGAFGHPGAGGSHAFGDPETGLSFAYVMNQMELSVFPGPKSTEMIEGLFGE